MYLFTSEVVSPGHPDKCTDSIVDRLIIEDSGSRVASEVFVTEKNVVIGGEVTRKENLNNDNYQTILLDALAKIGYAGKASFTNDECLHPDDIRVQVMLNQHSPDINQGIDQQDDEELSCFVHDTLPLTPRWITEKFSLDKPSEETFLYANVPARDQVGQSDYSWERLDDINVFKSLYKG